jgi:AbrB family looped-hinge helix DNA binding protein
METFYRARMNDNGRILIPAEARKRLGIRQNEELLLRVDDQGLHVAPLVRHLRAFRSEMREDIPSGVSLLEQLRLMRAQDAQ